jgi:K+-sensing histidine kinase KdpD/CheY-like chemotaxis protein
VPKRHSWRQNLKDLADLAETMISGSDPQQLYEQLTKRIAQITGAKGCLIATYEKAKKTFVAQKPIYGLKEKPGIPLVYESTTAYEDIWNFRKNGTLLSNHPQGDTRIHPYFVEAFSIRSLIFAPMIVQKELLGVIAVFNKTRGFTEFDSYLASIVAYQAGIILKNSMLMAAEKRTINAINLLNETARQMNSSLVLDEILELALTAMQKLLKMYEIGVYLPAENDSFLEMKTCSGPQYKQLKEQGYIQSIEVGMLGSAFRNANPVFTNDASSDPLFLNHPFMDTKSEACIPVKHAGKVMAVLDIQSTEVNAFSPDELLILETLADHIAVAFHNAVIYESERKHNDQMLLLSEIISELALITDRNAIVKTTVERIKQRFQYYFVAFGWVDEDEQMVRDWYYLPKFDVLKKRLQAVPLSRGVTGKAARTGKTVIASDTSKAPDYFNLLEEVRSELATPVRIGDTVVAVLDLESDRLGAFDESDGLIMETLAHALSTALQNADSYYRLERINHQLAETARMKDEIVQIVAHDFRSPLTVIRGYMDFLLKRGDWKDERQKEIMETVSTQAQRLQKLAEATLKASRLDSGDIAFSYEKLDFTSFLQRLIFPWSERHKFVTKVIGDLPLIRADAGRLQEVMENLLSNAIKYSPEGGQIEISARKIHRSELPQNVQTEGSENVLQVSVSDEGMGIPAEKKDLLFQRFSRIHENRRIEGIGLGLYIVKKMVEAQGGRIWVEDKQPKGARFCFFLPALDEEQARENILIVDDDIHTLRLLHKAISELGYDVITAADGKEAIDKLFRFKPNLIILDVLMPGISGLELIERLRRNPETMHIPVVVFTGKSDFKIPAQFEPTPVIPKNSGIQALKDFIQKRLSLA